MSELYDQLKTEGVEFPPIDLDSMAPVETTGRAVCVCVQAIVLCIHVCGAHCESNHCTSTIIRCTVWIVQYNLSLFFIISDSLRVQHSLSSNCQEQMVVRLECPAPNPNRPPREPLVHQSVPSVRSRLLNFCQSWT